MAFLPGALLPWIEERFFLEDGTLNAGGFIISYAAGTSTLQPLYTDAQLTVAASNPVTLGADGRPTTPLYMLPTGYRFEVQDANGVTLPGYSVDNIEDPGQVFGANLGNILTVGTASATTGYQVLSTDQFVTVNSTGASPTCVIYLPPATGFTNYLGIKNIGTAQITLTPNGSDGIENGLTSYVMPAAVSPTFPSVELASDGVSTWWIRASHGIAGL